MARLPSTEQHHLELRGAWFTELGCGTQADFNVRLCVQRIVVPVLFNSVVFIFW